MNRLLWQRIRSQQFLPYLAVIPGFSDRPVTQTRPPDTNPLNALMGVLWDNLISRAFLLLSSLAFLYLVYAGIQYITARNDPAKVKQARQSIVNIVLAIVIITAAFGIIGAIVSIARFIAQM